MAAYRRVYDSTSPACWMPRTGISSGTLYAVIEYGLPLPFKNKQQLDENLRSVNGGRRRCDLERGLSSYIQRAESMATDRSELFEVSLDVGGARRCWQTADKHLLGPRHQLNIHISSSLTFNYPRDAMIARVLAMALCLSVCPSVTSRSSVETAKQIELVFGMGASFLRPTLC